MATTKVTYNGSEIISQDMTAPVAVTYGGSTIVSVAAGETKTLNCNGLYMNTNIVVGSKTLNCANSIMASNVVVEVEGGSSGETWYFDEYLSPPTEYNEYERKINYQSNGNSYSKILLLWSGGFSPFDNNVIIYYGSNCVYDNNDDDWRISEAYRTITFEEPVTDETLLLFLQTNATKLS